MAYVKILVVEDDVIEAMDIKRTLESFGYSVPYVASRGEEAVTKALELMPDLILMDIVLKGETNGIEAALKIKDRNIPVIYLTAHSEESTVKKAKLTEPYGYLIKPYDVFELKFTIELALYKSKQERKLKESEENFRAIAENASEGILIAVGEGIPVYANHMAAEIMGYTIEELLKKTVADLAHPDEIQKLMERYKTRIDGKTLVSTYETRIVRREGTVVPVEITAAKTVWKGQPADMVIFRDISQRKRAEKELRKANLYNRSLIEVSLDPLVTIGPDGKITDVNTATEDVTGCSRDMLIGTDFSDYFTEPDKARDGYRQVFRDGFVRDYPLEIQHRGGGVTSVLYNASVYRDESGDVVGVFAAARDITDLKKVEEELKLAGLYNRSLIEVSLDPLVTIGPDGKITDVNTATEDVTGCSRDMLIGTDFSDYFTEPDKARDGYRQVFRDGFVRDYPLEIQHRGGGVTSVLYNASVYRDESGDVVGVFAAARDVNEYEKAKEKIQMLANVVESSDDAIIVKSLDGIITSWNKGAELIYGYSSEEIVGEDISVLAPPQLKNEIKKLIENVKKREHVLHYETIRVRKDGKEINISLSLSPIFDSSGKLIGISTIARDITQQKQSEEKLRKSEEKYRTLFEESFDGLFITSPEGKILDMNKKGIEMFGYDTKEEMLRLDLRRDVYADPNDRKWILDMVNKEGSAEYEVFVKKKNGDKMITYCSLTAVKDEKGVITSYRGIIRDITQRKKVEDAILQAKEEWEYTFDAVPDLIVMLDNNYRVVRANKAMADRLGVSPEEAVGVTCYEVVHGLNGPPSFCPHSRLLEDGQEHTEEVHEDRIGGDFIVSVSPLYDSEGKLRGSVHVARDITDRKKAEDEVKKSLKEKEVLLSEIHHRVKNNMQIISSLLNLQTQYVTDSETVDVLHESQDRVKAMANIYEKLFLSDDLTRISFNSYIQSLVHGLFYSYLIKEGQITPIIEIEDIMLNIETAVPCGLIISELVSNSLKHAFPNGRKGEIKVSLRSYGEKYGLLISDNGVGFPENIDFENTDTLGLKLVNNLLDQIDGEINLDRSHGTEFKIKFKELKYKRRI